MKTTIKCAFTTAAVILGLASSTQAASLMVNGSFETGTTTGWTTSGSFELNNFPARASDGVWLLQLGASTASTDGVFQQSLVTSPGQQYQIDLDFGKNGTGIGSAGLLVEAFGGSQLLNQTLIDSTNSNGTVSTTLDPYTFTFTADSASTLFRISDRSTGDTGSIDAHVDYIRIAATPEPSRGLLVVVGLMAILCRRNRRK